MGNKYILVEVIERNISVPEFFPTHEAAHKAMLEKFKEAMGLNDEDLAEAEPIKSVDGGFKIDGDCCFAWWNAYGERHGQNFDWKIFEL